MRDSARLRIATALALRAVLAAAPLPLTGCPAAQPVNEAQAAAGRRVTPPGTGVRTTLEVVYYDIEGRSEQDLLVAMREGGPQWRGRRFFGLTNTTLQYGYRHAHDGERCRPHDPSVLVAVTVTLPRWRKPPNAPYALDREWRSFERSLREHEDGHRVLAEQEGATLHLELDRLRAPNCAALDDAAGRLADAVRTQFGGRHREYDERTEHGRSQGASWPAE